VEIDLFRSSLAALVNVGQASLLTGEEAKRHGNAHPQIVPYRTFAASNGEFVIATGTDPQFARLAGVVGRPEWAEDPRYRTNPARVENRRELEGALENILRGAPRETWLARCRAAGVPAGPVRGPLEALTSEGARATGAVLSAGGLSFLATPLAVEGHTPRLDFPPALDADGDRLRSEFGFNPVGVAMSETRQRDDAIFDRDGDVLGINKMGFPLEFIADIAFYFTVGLHD